MCYNEHAHLVDTNWQYTWAPAEIFVGGGSKTKPLIRTKKAPHMEKKAVAKSSHIDCDTQSGVMPINNQNQNQKEMFSNRGKSSKNAPHIVKHFCLDFPRRMANAYVCRPPPPTLRAHMAVYVTNV